MLFMWEDGHTLKMEFGQAIRGLHHKHKRPSKCFITKNAIINGRVQGNKITKYLDTVQLALDSKIGKLYCYLEPYNV